MPCGGQYAFVGVNGTGTTDAQAWTPAAPAYAQLTARFTIGPATTSVTVYVHGWYGQGTVFADDFTIS